MSVSGKICALAALLAGLASCPALGKTPAQELGDRVSRLHGITASFVQRVYDEDGLELEKSSGSFKLNSDTSSFYIDTQKPEKSLLTCNGRDIYHYEEAVDQVTIYGMDSISRASPFWIVLEHDAGSLDRYSITRAGKGVFHLKEKEPSGDGQGAEYFLSFDDQGLTGAEMKDQNGQKVVYELSDRQFIRTIPSVEFVFLMPNGAAVDDRR
ncbi:MAG: outer membrane lipoprotein chaperone LolA [Succinivibrionaceae bacterium]|nr:outer membrane lipoprotein chaperone LolA [Succinivibrionaceae bacterium]